MTVSLKLSNSTLWGDAGHEIAFFQHQISPPKPRIIARGLQAPPAPAATIDENGPLLKVFAGKSTFEFSRVRGLLQGWTFNSGSILHKVESQQGALVPAFWRAPTDNDIGKAAPYWKSYGLHRLSTQLRGVRVDQDTHSGTITLTMRMHIGPVSLGWGWPATTIYRIEQDGSSMTVVMYLDDPVGDAPDYLPRMGFDLVLPTGLNRVSWCGRGPGESYPDKKQGQRVGVWNADSIAELQTSYEVPQENGNRTDTRWVTVYNESASTLLRATRMGSVEAELYQRIEASEMDARCKSAGDDNFFNFTATRQSAEMLEKAQHPQDLVEEDYVLLRLDAAVSGVGTEACGPGPMERHLVRPGKTWFGFTLELPQTTE